MVQKKAVVGGVLEIVVVVSRAREENSRGFREGARLRREDKAMVDVEEAGQWV